MFFHLFARMLRSFTYPSHSQVGYFSVPPLEQVIGQVDGFTKKTITIVNKYTQRKKTKEKKRKKKEKKKQKQKQKQKLKTET